MPVEKYDGTAPIAVWEQGNISFEVPRFWNKYPFQGEVYHFAGAAYSQIVTKNHKFLVEDKGSFREVTAEKLRSLRSGRLPYTGTLSCNYSSSPPKAIAQLVAAYQADGFYHQGRVGFHLKKQRKIGRLQALLLQAGIKFTVRETPQKTYYYTLSKEGSDLISCWGKIAGSYLLNWDSNSLIWFIDELKHWDGHVRTSNGVRTSVSTKSKEHAKWLHTIIHLCGYGSKMRSQLQTSRYNKNPWVCYEVSINKRKYASVESLHSHTLQYQGNVYCPTVSTGYFMVRHHGHISVCGNSNYLGTPYAIAVQKKIPRVLVENFQRNYFQEFPGIKEWQLKTIEALQTTGSLTTPTGARRVFWDRLSDDSTIKAAMAYLPQAGIAHVMNMGMIRMHYMVPECPLLAQVHDAVVFLIPKNNLDILRRVEEALVIPFAITDIKGVTRIVKIPVEINYGTSWHKKDMLLWEAS